MSDDQHEGQSAGAASSRPGRGAVIGAAAIVVLGVGWFALSYLVMDSTLADAAGEALGVMLALLVVASVVGAVTSGRGSPR